MPESHADQHRLSLRTRSGRRVMLPVLLAAMQNPLNSSLLVTALVPIGEEFHADALQTGWLIAGLYLSSGIFQATMGKFVDVFGARRTLLVGLCIAMVAGIFGSLAPALGWLIAARVCLGIGTAAGFPAAMAILRRVNGEGRPIPTGALSQLTIWGQVSVSFGPALSGAMVVLFGWRSTFWINIPIALIAIVMAIRWLPNDDKAPMAGKELIGLIDIPGILLFAATMSALVLSADRTIPHLPVIVAGVIALVAFVWRELVVSRPFVDLRMIASSAGLARTYLRQMITMIIIYTLFYGVAEWLQQAHGASPAIVGLIMIPVSVVAMGIAGTCARAIPPRIGLALGCAGAAVSCVFLGQVQAGASFVWIAAIFAISGAINGFNGVGNQAALYAQAPVAHVGVAAGIFRTVQYVGGILSATLIGTAFSGGATDAKFHVVTWILVGLSGLLALGVVGDRTIPAHDTVPAMR